MSAPEQLRLEMEHRGLDLDQLDSDPLVEFDRWYRLAEETRPGRWYEPNAMTLSTCGLQPSLLTSRTVLLKHYDANGLVFFTNYLSEKGRQLEENPHACVLLHWHYLGRQIRVSGGITKTDRAMSEAYFHTRSRASQLGALASAQSAELPSREHLGNMVSELEQLHQDQPVPLPDHWGGYILNPVRFEFWQGRLNRLHDRFRYDRVHAQPADRPQWTIQRLFP